MMRRRIALLALTAAAVAGCDYPTEPPTWEQKWEVPGDTLTISVAELLPTGVTLNDDTTAFVAQSPGDSVAFRLGDMCPECATADGLLVPKPAFDETLNTTSALPARLVAASLSGEAFPVTVGHDFNFDPLRPSADPEAERGLIAITVRSDGNVVADTTLSGETHALPPGATLSPTLNIRPVAIANELEIRVRLYSPAGDPVVIDASDTLGVAMPPATVQMAEATVTADDIALDPTPTSMEFAALDTPFLDRIRSGALLVSVDNPFTATGTVGIAFELPGETIQRDLVLEQGQYTSRLEFTGAEMRRILESGTVDLIASGTVAATGGTITLRPDQALVMASDFELILLAGGSVEEN